MTCFSEKRTSITKSKKEHLPLNQKDCFVFEIFSFAKNSLNPLKEFLKILQLWIIENRWLGNSDRTKNSVQCMICLMKAYK